MARGLRILVVDVGNTSTAVGFWQGGRVSGVVHCDGGFSEASKAAKGILSRHRGVECLAYVSVVPEADGRWEDFAKKNSLGFRQVSHQCFVSGRRHVPGELVIDYPRPETIGADRLADAAGAVERYGAPVIVMDFGTAFTAAAITDDRVWRGGVIAPGFSLMRDYLFERTAKLPRMKIGSGRAPAIGRSTEEAMRFGAIVGYRGMVREIAAQLKENFREDFKLVATGGFAKWALRDSRMDFTVDPDLTLYGIGLIAAKTKRRNV